MSNRPAMRHSARACTRGCSVLSKSDLQRITATFPHALPRELKILTFSQAATRQWNVRNESSAAVNDLLLDSRFLTRVSKK